MVRIAMATVIIAALSGCASSPQPQGQVASAQGNQLGSHIAGVSGGAYASGSNDQSLIGPTGK